MSQDFTPNDVMKIKGKVKYNSGNYTAGLSGEYQVADLVVTVDMSYEKDGVPQPKDMDFKVGFFQDKCDCINMAKAGDFVDVSCRVKANGYMDKKTNMPNSFLKLDGFACTITPANGAQPATPSYQAPASYQQGPPPAPYQQQAPAPAPAQYQQQQQQQAPAPMNQIAPAPAPHPQNMVQQQAPAPAPQFDQSLKEDIPF